jgi:hypothetical protein
MKTRFEANFPLTQMSLMARVYGPERNTLFAIDILPVHSGLTSSECAVKHQWAKAVPQPLEIRTLGVNDELSAKFRYTG